MDHVIAIVVGLGLRAVIDIQTDSDYRLTSTLVGLWEGCVLSHFLHKYRRNPSDAYLALATRFAIDFLLVNSPVRSVLTGAWTLVGLLLADVAPSVWRETGLRYVYRALRKDFKAMRRSAPRWRIENDIQVPNISISNPVPGFLSRPSSTIVSSTRAAPPASPAQTLQRRSTLGSPSSQGTPSVTNTLTREVLLGPSPALIHIDVDPGLPHSFNLDPPSHLPSLLSSSSDSGSSRHDPIPVPDNDRVHTAVPSQMQRHDQEQEQEQEQEQGPDLSVLNLTPPVAALETTTTFEIISPTPRAHIGILPHIPDSEIDLSIHAPPVPLPESSSTYRVGNLLSTCSVGISSQNARTSVGEVGPGRGPNFGNARTPSHQRASSAGVLGQTQNQPTFGNQPNSTGYQPNSRWQHSMLRHSEQDILSDGAAGIGGFVIHAGGPMPQHSGTPRAHSGNDGVRMSSARGSSTPLSLSKTLATLPNPAPATLPNPVPVTLPNPVPVTLPNTAPATLSNTAPDTLSNTAPASAPQTKPPTLAPLTRQTTPTLRSNLRSGNAELRSTTPAPALPSKTPTPAPLSRTPTPMEPSKTPTPKPKSRCTSPGLTSTSVRNTDYDPANPIRPMLTSPSTEPDSIFPGAGARNESTTGEFNPLDTGDTYDDPPPPFKEFESPVHPRGANFGAGVDDRKGLGKQVAGGSGDEGATAEGDAKGEGLDGVAKGEGEVAITNTNIGDVDNMGGQGSGEGAKETIETSQDVGCHARGADIPNREDGAREKQKDSQEQEKSGQNGEDNRGVIDNNQATCEDANLASGDTQIAGDETQDIDSALKPEPTPLTPAQKEAETHRGTFLLKEVGRLEQSRTREKLDSSDEQGSSEIQARLSAVKARISRIIFADPPRRSPPMSEVPSSGKNAQELTSTLTNTIVDLLLERQDAEPIRITVPYTKTKQKNVEKILREFNADNNFSIRSETGHLSTVITV